MKQYMLAVHDVEGAIMPEGEELQQLFADVEAVNEQIRKAGAWVFGGGLMPPTSATVVRVEKGQAVLTDGPYAETKEHLGGFWVIQAADLDEALRWAEKATVACRAPIEVRPFQDEPET
jgi:hypothetical protein